ncbi:MAG: hypothetical protein ACEQSB_00250 [Undibacterium sp.]
MTQPVTSAVCESDDAETQIERRIEPVARFSLSDHMFVERGDISDWNLLHDLHYKAEKLPLGPRFWKMTLFGETIGVLVTGTPKGMVRERHLIFPNIKPKGGDTRLINTNRYNYLNKNFRVISRFVVDTMYRGIGAGYRMMNLVSRMEGNTFMEIQSSMSKFNIFGQKAGFKFTPPMNANMFDVGMKFFRSNFESNPQDFEAIVAEIETSSSDRREALMQACREFYLRRSASENLGAAREKAVQKIAGMSSKELIKAIQQMALSSPLYGVWKCPDVKGTVPARLPLSAFDWQKFNEKLKVPEGFDEAKA